MQPTAHETCKLFKFICDREPPHSPDDPDARFALDEVLEWCELGDDRSDDVQAALQLAVNDGTMATDGVMYWWVD